MKLYCPYCMGSIQSGEYCPLCGKSPKLYQPSSHHLPPSSLLQNRYVIGKVLGEGGFGITYLGLDMVLERKVAVKEYFPNVFVRRQAALTLDVTCHTDARRTLYEKGRDQFLQEARVMAKLDLIPEIVRVLDFFPAHRTAYIVMEFLEGDTFRTLLAKQKRIPAKILFEMMEPVLRALAAAHSMGIIHRDISPDNIIQLHNGQVKLLDFGCARNVDESHTMTVMLKHGYAPIEQYTGHNQGAWTDIYALCATLYCCLTGRVPPRALMRLDDDNILVPPNRAGAALTAEQEQALLKGLEVMPKNRFHSMADLYAGLYGRVIKRYSWQKIEEQETEIITDELESEVILPRQKPKVQSTPHHTPKAEPTPRQQAPKATPKSAVRLQRKARPTRFPLTFQPQTLEIGTGYMIGIKPEGTVLLCMRDNITPKAEWKIHNWSHMVSICSLCGFMVGLRADGSVFIAHNKGGIQQINGWYDIIAIACGTFHIVGLRANGTVCAVPAPYENEKPSTPNGECNVQGWTDIVAIAAGHVETMGLKADGTVICTSKDGTHTLDGWTNIIAITDAESIAAGLRADGTVKISDYDYKDFAEVWQWQDIVAIKAGFFHIVGLKADGTVVASGENELGQCNVSEWKDVVAIAAGGMYTAAMKKDGTVLVTGRSGYTTGTKGWVLRQP